MGKFIVESGTEKDEAGTRIPKLFVVDGTRDDALAEAKKLSAKGKNVVVYQAIAEINYEPVVKLFDDAPSSVPPTRPHRPHAQEPIVDFEPAFQLVKDFASGARVICICGTMYEFSLSHQDKCPSCGVVFPIEDVRAKKYNVA